MYFVLASIFWLVGVGAGDTSTCYLPIDVLFLQDTTGSFIEDLPNVKAQIPTIIESINKHNPGSYFGVSEFRDKPYLYLGELNDFCTRRVHHLSSDISSVEKAFGKLFASGGADLPEASLAAVIDSVNDQDVGWRSLKPANDDDETAGARLIIMSTDAKPHDPGDYDLYVPTSPSYLPPYPDDVAGISQDSLCRRYDYPSVHQMKAHLQAQTTFLAVLTPDDDPEVTAKWRWINDDVLQNPSGFYQFIKNDSSDILQAIISVLSEVTSYVCSQSNTVAPTDETTASQSAIAPTTETSVTVLPTRTTGHTTTAPPPTPPPKTTTTTTAVASSQTTSTTATKPEPSPSPTTTALQSSPSTPEATTALTTPAIPSAVATTGQGGPDIDVEEGSGATEGISTGGVQHSTSKTETSAVTVTPITTQAEKSSGPSSQFLGTDVTTTGPNSGATTQASTPTIPETQPSKNDPTCGSSGSDADCGGCCEPPCANLVIAVNDQPKRLTVDYES